MESMDFERGRPILTVKMGEKLKNEIFLYFKITLSYNEHVPSYDPNMIFCPILELFQ